MCVVGELWNQAFRRKNRTEEKSVQWWSRHVNYDCLRKFSDRNLSVCLNPKSIPTFTIHHVHPYLSWSDQMPVNSKFYNLNFCRGPNVSTKPVTKFLQNGFRIVYCLIRYSFTLGEKWQPLNIEISWVFLKWKWNESNSKVVFYPKKYGNCILMTDVCFLQRWMFNTLGTSKPHYTRLMDHATVIFVIDESVWNANIGMNLSFVNHFVNNWSVW